MTRRQRQKRRRQRHGGAVRRVVLIATGAVAATALVAVLGVVGYVMAIAASAPSIDTLQPIDKGATSVVYAADGSRLGFIRSDELRTPLPGARIPRILRQATVAIEDQRFYQHAGVDYEGVIRAAVQNLKSGKTIQGGSTLTMQLVRNLYISGERTFQRKIREAKLAQELEQEHSKAWVLTRYLNDVPYGTVGGQTAIGVAAAARLFFDKPVARLTLAQAALLAGLPQAPSEYNPFLNPSAARVRRNAVLRKMASLHMVAPARARAAIAAPLGVRHNSYYTARRESYFFDYVKQELIDRYGINRVRKGGLKVETTIEPKLQQAARDAMRNRLPYPGDPAAAVVTIDPANGDILAMASSSSYARSEFNLAAQGHRQAGSTFKVMVLMTALRMGVDPRTTHYVSRPLSLDTPYGHWDVHTYGGTYGGSMNLVQATLASDNTVYAQLDLDLGPDAVRKTAYAMGITTHLDAYPAEGLGGLRLGVSPLEMANAYATIASGGWRNAPVAIRRVVFPDGHADDVGRPKRKKAFPDGVTHAATEILHQNVLGGTGTAANFGCPAAGKTGTVDDFTDAWFVGFTPKLATSVWVGYPDKKVAMTNVHGIAVTGGSFPAQIWHDYMAVAHGSDCSDFPAPKEPISYQPFSGTYVQTDMDDDDELDDADGKDSKRSDRDDDGRGDDRPGNGGIGDYADDKIYAAPPQGPVKTVPVPTAPAGGGGTGHGPPAATPGPAGGEHPGGGGTGGDTGAGAGGGDPASPGGGPPAGGP